MSQKWTSKWPTELGWYWFCGWTSRVDRRCSPLASTYLVRIARSLDDVIYGITEGMFIFEKDGAEGQWLKAQIPCPSNTDPLDDIR